MPQGVKENGHFLCIYLFKVRSSIAYAISAVAHWDWPENWPGLFDILVNYLSSNNEWQVQAAMRLLTEISPDLTDMSFAPVILSEMYRIFEDEQVRYMLQLNYILVIHFVNFYVK